ncbi:MAG: 5-(carboxyamino)imidazole ribonucleotide synthase [Methylophilaceae bacterium]|nr:5-(carboxyamino)imidazole ribonucleotide synthase [Methylophilaceae bacterium]
MNVEKVILPPAMLGMLGGGQLGRFFVIAAHEMGYKVTVLDPDQNSPAGKIADVHLCAVFDNVDALNTLASTCDAISTEFENVPATTLETLANTTIVRPSAASVAIAQHRVSEKNFLQNAGLPVAPFVVINITQDLPEDISDIYPAILKVARFGYDGKGQARVKSNLEAQQAFTQFKGEECVLEKMLKLDYEVSVVLARDVDGNIAAFPTAENSHLNGILDVTIVPARDVTTHNVFINQQAQTLAARLAETLNYVGVLGVEFFICNGELLVNEIAPRTHNSGHYTIDACVTNQFEQQVRVMTGLPLGDARLHSNVVMVNLLGDIWQNNIEPAWNLALSNPKLKMHLYRKHEARAGRKMGHFTVIGEHKDEILADAMKVRNQLGVDT